MGIPEFGADGTDSGFNLSRSAPAVISRDGFDVEYFQGLELIEMSRNGPVGVAQTQGTLAASLNAWNLRVAQVTHVLEEVMTEPHQISTTSGSIPSEGDNLLYVATNGVLFPFIRNTLTLRCYGAVPASFAVREGLFTAGFSFSDVTESYTLDPSTVKDSWRVASVFVNEQQTQWQEFTIQLEGDNPNATDAASLRQLAPTLITSAEIIEINTAAWNVTRTVTWGEDAKVTIEEVVRMMSDVDSTG